MERFSGRWFTAIPMNYGEHDPAFWYRDVGALCLGFQKLGVDSRMVAWGTPSERTNPPVILCTADQMADANWWRQWKVDGVALTSWAIPRFERYARAIRQSGARLIVRLDSDGLISPRINFRRFLWQAYFRAKDDRRVLPAIRAFSKALAFRCFKSAYDVKACDHLSHTDIIVIESPLAKRQLVRWMRGLGRTDLEDRIRVLVNPASAEIVYQPGVPKQPKILAVGRWATCQKDAPLLMEVLRRALPYHPNYTAALVGSGQAVLEKLRARLPADIQRRVQIIGQVENKLLHQHYLNSQVLLFTSRYEGFPFTASEALCCGCTVVGAALLPSLNYVCCAGGGTLAASRSAQDLADALGAEIGAWQCRQRDPEKISRYWIERASTKAVAAAMLGFFDRP